MAAALDALADALPVVASVRANAAVTNTSATIGIARSVNFNFMPFPPVGFAPVPRASSPGLICPGGGIALWIEDAEHPHVVSAGVLEAVLDERRKMDAAALPERRLLAAEVEEPLALGAVDRLVVHVAVRCGPARRDRPDELGHVDAADVLVDEEAELAIGARLQHRLLRGPHGPAVAGCMPCLLGRAHGHEHELVRAGVLHRVRLARRDEDARVRL